MGLFHYLWSRTAASNATADSNVNWAEGMAPSAVNDSARAMMASAAAFRDDISGAITTGGTSTAYTVTSYQVFDSLAHMNGQMIAFTPHATNGATVTLNVDSLGAKPLRSAPSVELPAGVLVLGTPYVALYNSSDQAFYLHNFYSSPYLVPIGGLVDYTGSTSPNSAFVIPAGQAISRSTYATYFSLVGTAYGSGDGSTTFNVPDLRGRVVAMLDSSASVVNSTTMSPDGNTLGASGGGQTSQLVTANLPPYTPSGSVSSSTSSTVGDWATNVQTGSIHLYGTSPGNAGTTVISGSTSSSFTGTAQGGTSTAFTNMQPTMMLNKLLRII